MPNTNCLEGLSCPKCGSLGPFRITAECFALVSDDGVECTTDVEWDQDSPCWCKACDFGGDINDFSASRVFYETQVKLTIFSADRHFADEGLATITRAITHGDCIAKVASKYTQVSRQEVVQAGVELAIPVQDFFGIDGNGDDE